VTRQRPRQSSTEQRQIERRHIFIVNGAPVILDLLRELFQAEAYNVTTTNFVPQTFDQIAALTPDLLMVDVVVGDQAGWELLEQLHAGAATRGIPVIIFSTSPALLDRARHLETPASTRRFLAKPFDLAALLALVEELIGPA
jgi:DNA-binding response OmpR family regulator